MIWSEADCKSYPISISPSYIFNNLTIFNGQIVFLSNNHCFMIYENDIELKDFPIIKIP